MNPLYPFAHFSSEFSKSTNVLYRLTIITLITLIIVSEEGACKIPEAATRGVLCK